VQAAQRRKRYCLGMAPVPLAAPVRHDTPFGFKTWCFISSFGMQGLAISANGMPAISLTVRLSPVPPALLTALVLWAVPGEIAAPAGWLLLGLTPPALAPGRHQMLLGGCCADPVGGCGDDTWPAQNENHPTLFAALAGLCLDSAVAVRSGGPVVARRGRGFTCFGLGACSRFVRETQVLTTIVSVVI